MVRAGRDLKHHQVPLPYPQMAMTGSVHSHPSPPLIFPMPAPQALGNARAVGECSCGEPHKSTALKET